MMSVVVKSLKEFRAKSDKELEKEHGKEWMKENKKLLDRQWEYELHLGILQEAPAGKEIMKITRETKKAFSRLYGKPMSASEIRKKVRKIKKFTKKQKKMKD